MASPLLLALSASAALVAGPALACEGQGCWGMAPAQELNPGYTGPDYSQFAPPGPDYGPGPGGYDDGDVDPAAYGDDPRPYVGPIEGLRDQQQARAWRSAQTHGYGGGYGPPPPAYEDSGGYGPGGPDGYGPADASGEDVYGPPRDYSPSNGDSFGGTGGEPPSVYAPAGPGAAYGYDRYGYSAPYSQAQGYGPAMGPPPGAGDAGPPPPPYQAYRSDGYEHYAHSGSYAAGDRSQSYRAGSTSEYDYDSGWVPDDAPSPYGPAPCDRCGGER